MRSMKKYPFREIEQKWQRFWEEHETFKATEDPTVPKEKRRYVLDMFPYPSAAGLHVGHPEGYTATDIYCRYLRMNGYNVLHPMGFDSFGLPAENYAVQTGTHPKATTEANIERFREQIKSLGFSYDWSREVSTHRKDYYKWTQWIFLKLWEQGLAYVAEIPMWYCEDLGTVLANEEVISTEEGPRSERGNFPVERRPLRQWMLKITEYADRLLDDLDNLDWPESIKAMQRNWIGRSEGANVVFPLADPDRMEKAGVPTGERHIEVYTTRPDTLFGATYMVMAPEHGLVPALTTPEQAAEVRAYVDATRLKSDLERTELSKEKTGVFTGSYAINPVNGVKVPIWISDYILASYGTGAIMAVPGHDERDWEFAQKFDLPIIKVVAASPDEDPAQPLEAATPEYGYAVNSDRFDGMPTVEAKAAIIDWLESEQIGTRAINYKLRDWIFSRQRYWGEPIPLVECDGEYLPIPYDQLPVTLPEVESYKPTGTGESPLAAVPEWAECPCPDGSGRIGRRETNTMPQWAGSCWYYLRYLDPDNTESLADREKIDYWMPIDLYVGGAEHAVLHLLYARFWHKVLFDIGVVTTDEPFMRLVNQGMILGENGVKMSKSLGNVINPDDIVSTFGADSMRVYEMFMGPLQQEKPWSTQGLTGVYRFLDRVWRLTERPIVDTTPDDDLQRTLHKTIKKVGHDTNRLAFNTAISQMMILVNELYKRDDVPRSVWDPFVRLLSPYAPHLAEELWEMIGNEAPVSLTSWPKYEESLTVDDQVEVVLQINGKIRGRIQVEAATPGDTLQELAQSQERITELLDGKTVVKTIVVPDKLVNFVVK